MTTLRDFLLLPSLTAQTQCLLRAWEKLGVKQHSPAAKSREAKPKTEVALKEYINGIVKKCPFLPHPKMEELQDTVWNLRKVPSKQKWKCLIVSILIHSYR